MSLAVTKSYTSIGVDALPISIEVHLSNGLPAFNIVGMPETAVKESRERVRSAILNSQFDFPAKRITVNLAPADVPKHGGRFDLAIAIGLLAASGQLGALDVVVKQLKGVVLLAELSLSGALKPVVSSLTTAWAAHKADQRLICAQAESQAMSILSGKPILLAQHLTDVTEYFITGRALVPLNVSHFSAADKSSLVTSHMVVSDISEVRGQVQAKRALEVAAAGGHHMLLVGPPGAGKTMLASRMPSLLPLLDDDGAMEVALVHSVANVLRDDLRIAPFRNPHHSASAAAIVGGGSVPVPGEISLSHRGVLFLDELVEFPPKVLDMLREPLETGVVHISRANHKLFFPALFQLIAAMNPCPCGYSGSSRCRCHLEKKQKYFNRLSGPLLDRFDLQIWLQPPSREELLAAAQGDTSQQVQQRVLRAQTLQKNRQGCLNQMLGGARQDAFIDLDKQAKHLLEQAIDKLQLSARASHRLLRVARTIADLAQSKSVLDNHVSEALNYRQLDAFLLKN